MLSKSAWRKKVICSTLFCIMVIAIVGYSLKSTCLSGKVLFAFVTGLGLLYKLLQYISRLPMPLWISIPLARRCLKQSDIIVDPKVTCVPEETFFPNPRMQEALDLALRSNRNGVRILFAENGVGKSTNVRHALAHLLQQGNINCVLNLCGSHYQPQVHKANIISWLSSHKNIYIPTTALLHDILSPKIILFIDQFDDIVEAHAADPTTANRPFLLVRQLAQISVECHLFTVLLVVMKEENFTRLIEMNNDKKIKNVFLDPDVPDQSVRSPFAWSGDELGAVRNVFLSKFQTELSPHVHALYTMTTIGELVDYVRDILSQGPSCLC